MKRKIALKRLSSSDLTLFEHHYRHTSGAKQKAINLDTAVFVDIFFPGLPSRIDVNSDRVVVTLVIYGPGGAEAHSITRKILKQQKNWRLNGELIFSPPEEAGRYDHLEKGDFAILDFTGDAEPRTVRICLIAQALPQDTALYEALNNGYGKFFSPRKGMLEIDPDEFSKLLNGLNLPESHPVLDFVDFDILEDAAQGGTDGVVKLIKRRQMRGVSREELVRARQSAEQIGRLGEELLNAWFRMKIQSADWSEYRWESDSNAVAPYDFSLVDVSGVKRRIDAKSTAGDFRSLIHVSTAELLEMARGGVPYDLYRLYSVNESAARLRIACNLGGFAEMVLERFVELPNGIYVDGISINPEILDFGEEIMIDLSLEDEGNGHTSGDFSED